ncbi:cytokine like 1 L homeolog precursor [Xenopus laevis]|uniref:Cytokine like 1 L homeolog precursor n=2 Tax=Xenopus laevis TaxID=8355 RepID=A1A634_XENLA|nr:cytokine like 1 L homeolog precursor [Xenopus laevis]AAI28943.1 LOC100036817 protein [Xenopus laevis]OCT99332.1 hypothetical protein XELAEV_18005109mg [Xenopus laevis]
MKLLLSLLALSLLFLFVCSAPPTCYSKVFTMSKEITDAFQRIQKTAPPGPCLDALPTLYLDIHNSCVMNKLRTFISAPRCGRMPRVEVLKRRVRKLYNIMNSVCKRDLVFFTDDCAALEVPLSTFRPITEPSR